MPSSANNGQLGQLLSDLRARSHRRRLKRLYAMIALGLMLGLLVMLATGCASPQPTPCEPQPTISMPVVPLSAPTTSFSKRVANYLERSRQLLISASATTKP